MEDKGLQAIKERLAAVSKEQWVAQLGDPMNWEPSSVRLESGEMVANRLNAEQAEFIANAHQDVPALIAEVERFSEQSSYWYNEFLKVSEMCQGLHTTLETIANHNIFTTPQIDVKDFARESLKGEKPPRTPEQNAVIDKVIADLQALDGDK